LQFVCALQRGQCGNLADVRRADEHVLGQPFDRADMGLRDDHPADAPSGHGEILGERIDDIGLIGDLQRANCFGLVFDPVVDFVGDKAGLFRLRCLDQIGQFRFAQHRARGIGR